MYLIYFSLVYMKLLESQLQIGKLSRRQTDIFSRKKVPDISYKLSPKDLHEMSNSEKVSFESKAHTKEY